MRIFSSIATSKLKEQVEKYQSRNLPKKIVFALFRQNIKNYNPYLATLEQLEEEKLSYFEKEHIRNLCFLGLAKLFLKNKKYSNTPTYNRVNVLIRTYMREKMCE